MAPARGPGRPSLSPPEDAVSFRTVRLGLQVLQQGRWARGHSGDIHSHTIRQPLRWTERKEGEEGREEEGGEEGRKNRKGGGEGKGCRTGKPGASESH